MFGFFVLFLQVNSRWQQRTKYATILKRVHSFRNSLVVFNKKKGGGEISEVHLKQTLKKLKLLQVKKKIYMIYIYALKKMVG